MNFEEAHSKSITDLLFMINTSNELKKDLNPDQNMINNNKIDIINKDYQNRIKENNDLKKEVETLKNTIISFEENYGYISPYHDDILNKLKEKKGNQILTNEISQKIYELYQHKYYNDCYDLWSVYGFRPLKNKSSEDNYEILRHLTKVKDELYRRKYILNNLDNFNLFNDNNLYFETGIFFKSIHNNDKNLQNNDSIHNNNNSDIKNNVSFKSEIPRTYKGNIFKQKVSENNILLEELKNKVLNHSYI